MHSKPEGMQNIQDGCAAPAEAYTAIPLSRTFSVQYQLWAIIHHQTTSDHTPIITWSQDGRGVLIDENRFKDEVGQRRAFRATGLIFIFNFSGSFYGSMEGRHKSISRLVITTYKSL